MHVQFVCQLCANVSIEALILWYVREWFKNWGVEPGNEAMVYRKYRRAFISRPGGGSQSGLLNEASSGFL